LGPWLEPNYAVAHDNLGRVFSGQGRLEEALKLEPESAENHDNLGGALAQPGKLEEAISHFNKTMEIDNSYEKARGHLSLARQELEKRR
jgi:tetratricopeptide (TPR) repeat protein